MQSARERRAMFNVLKRTQGDGDELSTSSRDMKDMTCSGQVDRSLTGWSSGDERQAVRGSGQHGDRAECVGRACSSAWRPWARAARCESGSVAFPTGFEVTTPRGPSSQPVGQTHNANYLRKEPRS